MQKILAQLTLGLSLQDEATFANFFPGRNTEIISALQATITQQSASLIYLCGTRGQGCSHLLQACCHYAHQQQISSAYFPLATLIDFSPEVLKGFEDLELICIDDLHAIANLPAWEEAIFHLYNRVRDANGKLVIAAHDLPNALNLQLADLVSRLTWGIVYQLHPLSDDEKLHILQMRAQRRGIKISEDVGKFLLTHCPRHMTTLFAALDTLDKASLAAQRRLTIPFIKEVLQI